MLRLTLRRLKSSRAAACQPLKLDLSSNQIKVSSECCNVQLVPRQQKRVGFGPIQTPTGTKAIQKAACAVSRCGENKKSTTLPVSFLPNVEIISIQKTVRLMLPKFMVLGMWLPAEYKDSNLKGGWEGREKKKTYCWGMQTNMVGSAL